MNILKRLAKTWDSIIGKPFNTLNTYSIVGSRSLQPMITATTTGSHQALSDKEIEQLVYEKFKNHVKLREGEVKDPKTGLHIVYFDSLNKPTVGWGHLVLPSDKLKIGDHVTEARVSEFFKKDSLLALDAAYRQAEDLGHPNNVNFIAALASVNYQLGSGWPNEFKNTYSYLKQGKYNNAIKNLRRSLWFKQTPVRVNDFIDAIAKL